MSSLNKAMIIGNVGQDPKIFEGSEGLKIAKFSMATSENYKGEEKTQWHNVTFFGRTAEVIEKYIKKGDKIYVEGKMQSSEYVDKEGINRRNFVVLGSMMQMLGGSRAAEGVKEDSFPAKKEAELDDDIPF